MKKIDFFIIILFFLFSSLFILRFASGAIVCGQVYDSDDNMSASWFKINIYLSNQKISECDISPAENKYCCDTELYKEGVGKFGDIVYAEIFDKTSGYFAGPVSLTISNEGFSVFPEMKLYKAIKINNPKSKLIISNFTNVSLEIEFKYPYNFIKIEKNLDDILTCENCSFFNKNLNFNFGENNIKINASSNSKSFFEEIKFFIVNFIDYKRIFSCKSCKNNKIKANEIANVTLFFNFSHEIKDLEIKEFVPIDFEIIDSNEGIIERYSETHNIIKWKVSGKNILINYKIKAPYFLFFSRKYLFKLEIEDKEINNEKIKVYNIFSFISFKKSLIERSFSKISYSRIAPDKVLVLKPKGRESEIKRIAVFPKREFKDVYISLFEFVPQDKKNNLIKSYILNTNLKEQDINRVYIEFKINKNILIKNNYKKIIFSYFIEGTWKEIELEKYDENDKYLYYKINLNQSIQEFSILGV